MNSRMSANSGANAQANRAAATANPEYDAGMNDDVFDTFDDIDTGGAFGVSDGLGGGDPFGSDPFAPMGSAPMGGQSSFNSDPFGSAGNFGMNFGFIQGVLKAYSIPYELVTPQKWKKEFSCTSDKNTSIEVCKRLFPNVNLKATDRCKKDHDGIAEALLIAEYGRRHYNGNDME